VRDEDFEDLLDAVGGGTPTSWGLWPPPREASDPRYGIGVTCAGCGHPTRPEKSRCSGCPVSRRINAERVERIVAAGQKPRLPRLRRKDRAA